MISMQFLKGQGLGNQLWVYAATRSIAEQLDLPFHTLSPENFKGAAFLELEMPRAPEQAQGLDFQERLYYDPELDYIASDYDSRVESIQGAAILNGLFQSEKYFFGDLARPQRYIRLKQAYQDRLLIDDRTCVLNIRGGEYKRHKRFILPKSYWVQAMDWMRVHHGIEKFVAVSDDDRYVKALLPGVPVLEGGIAEDYAVLYQCKYAIVSNSSFAYFPLKTGAEKASVIGPAYWARFNQSQHGRWASPANVYTGWQWMTPNGTLMPAQACTASASTTMRHYNDNYHIMTSQAALTPKSIRSLIPTSVKTGLKRVLSIAFPKSIG